MASKEGCELQKSLRQRIGMQDTSPGAAISEAWQEMEQALAETQPHLEVLGEAVQGDAELEEAVSVAIEGTAKGFQAAAEALETVETSLIEAKLLDPEDTEGFEPGPGTDA